MNCKQCHDHLLDLASGTEVSEARAHVAACSACATQLASLQRTMSLLDEWSAPADVSPFFMTRLQARVREEGSREAAGWLSWFRKPGLAVAMTLLMVLSIGLFQGGWQNEKKANEVHAQLKPGTPVADLQYLDKNHEVLADFELLDGLGQN